MKPLGIQFILFLFYMALDLYRREGASTMALKHAGKKCLVGQKTVTCYPVVHQNDKVLLELLVELSVGIGERMAVGSID